MLQSIYANPSVSRIVLVIWSVWTVWFSYWQYNSSCAYASCAKI